MAIVVKNLMRIRVPWRMSLSEALRLGAPNTSSQSDFFSSLQISRSLHQGTTYIDCSAVQFDNDTTRKEIREYAADNGQRRAHPLELLAVTAHESWLASDLSLRSIALIAGVACTDKDDWYLEYERVSQADRKRVYLGVRYVAARSSERGNQRFAHPYFFDPWPQAYWHLLVDDEKARRRLSRKPKQLRLL